MAEQVRLGTEFNEIDKDSEEEKFAKQQAETLKKQHSTMQRLIFGIDNRLDVINMRKDKFYEDLHHEQARQQKK